jgi:hypothetical protein
MEAATDFTKCQNQHLSDKNISKISPLCITADGIDYKPKAQQLIMDSQIGIMLLLELLRIKH